MPAPPRGDHGRIRAGHTLRSPRPRWRQRPGPGRGSQLDGAAVAHPPLPLSLRRIHGRGGRIRTGCGEPAAPEAHARRWRPWRGDGGHQRPRPPSRSGGQRGTTSLLPVSSGTDPGPRPAPLPPARQGRGGGGRMRRPGSGQPWSSRPSCCCCTAWRRRRGSPAPASSALTAPGQIGWCCGAGSGTDPGGRQRGEPGRIWPTVALPRTAAAAGRSRRRGGAGAGSAAGWRRSSGSAVGVARAEARWDRSRRSGRPLRHHIWRMRGRSGRR
ncbi:hypothetical protein C2845_PM01G14170 [Panicum miliaceum]|uniref:Uncharacterized protein n=1 Tax=Panicum miliaceum TaxID=4540 RepID=A0A3L6TNJ8_PANMI|nr:hypothetical protein C2845_PM01G14170 [Panicum miliaceum]